LEIHSKVSRSTYCCATGRSLAEKTTEAPQNLRGDGFAHVCDIATGRFGDAGNKSKSVLTQASKSGNFLFIFDARLALAESAMQSRKLLQAGPSSPPWKKMHAQRISGCPKGARTGGIVAHSRLWVYGKPRSHHSSFCPNAPRMGQESAGARVACAVFFGAGSTQEMCYRLCAAHKVCSRSVC